MKIFHPDISLREIIGFHPNISATTMAQVFLNILPYFFFFFFMDAKSLRMSQFCIFWYFVRCQCLTCPNYFYDIIRMSWCDLQGYG